MASDQESLKQPGSVGPQPGDLAWRLSKIIEGSHSGTWEWNVQTGETVFNERWAEIVGYTLAELQPLSIQTWIRLCHPDDYRAARTMLERHFKGELDRYEMDMRLRHKNGHWTWVTAKGVVASWTADHKPLRMFGTHADISPRKAIEADLASSRAKLVTALDAMSDAVFISDADGRFADFNEAFATFHKFHSKADCARTLAEYPAFLEVRFPDGSLAPLDQWAVPRALRGETAAGAEFQLRRKDTGEAWTGSYNFAPIRGQGGAIVGSVVTARDITERRAAEEELRGSKVKLEAALEAMADAVFITDAQGRILEFNEAFATFHKFKSRAECPRTREGLREVLDFFLPDGSRATLAQRPIARALAGESATNVEYRLTRTDTGQTWLAGYNIAPLRGPDGAVVGAVILGRDVTERKLAERSLASAVERLDLATKAAGLGIWDWDIQSNHLAWDQQMHRLYGTRHEDFGGAMGDWLASVHPEDRERATLETDQALAGTFDYDTKFRVVHPGGEIRHIRSQATVVRDSAGKALRMIGVNWDVTPQHRQEADKAQLESQLAQAQRLESIGRLAGGVAHDFNNMLGVILAQAELGMEDLDPRNPIYESLAEIERTAERSAQLTRQLLAFARKQTIDPRVLDLNQSVSALYKMLSRLIDASIVLAWRPEPGTWLVKMDPTQVDQVLANLCVNARDAISGAGRISIQVGNATLGPQDCESHPDCRPGDFAWLSVGDTGSGMGPETLAHLFEPFFTTKAVGKGTGLGLATVYGIVQQNHGFIQVDSVLGQGSTFKIFLPRHQGPDGPAGAPAPAPRHGITGETVLVVEDEPAMLRMATQMVRSLGYDVLSAPSPAQALDLARRHPTAIHLLLTDVVMPGMNGRELSEAMLAWHPAMKRVYMSGYTSDIIAPEGILDESTDFLSKPFTKQALAEKLRAALDR